MSTPTLRTGALALVLLSSLSACANLSQLFVEEQDQGLRQVDTLLANIEHVQMEAALARRRMAAALEALSVVVNPDFGGDALAAYASFVHAIQNSEKQAAQLNASIDPMKASAQKVFADWTADLRAFRSEQMRDRSRERLDEALGRYGELLSELEPAQAGLDQLNTVLRDHALFLANDFNADSVTALETEYQTVSRQLAMVDQQFINSQRAAKNYVRTTALRGQLVLARDPSRSRPVGLSATSANTSGQATGLTTTDDPATPTPAAAPSGSAALPGNALNDN